MLLTHKSLSSSLNGAADFLNVNEFIYRVSVDDFKKLN